MLVGLQAAIYAPSDHRQFLPLCLCGQKHVVQSRRIATASPRRRGGRPEMQTAYSGRGPSGLGAQPVGSMVKAISTIRQPFPVRASVKLSTPQCEKVWSR